MRLGPTELLLILGIAVLLFGHRLPGIGKSLGEGIRGFKKGMTEDDQTPKELDEGDSQRSQKTHQNEKQR